MIKLKDLINKNKININEVTINNKEVDVSTIEIEGVDTREGPDDGTSEAFASAAEFYKGGKLNDNQYKFVGSQVSLSSNKTNDIGQLPAGSGNGTTVLATRQLVIT